MRSLFDIGSTLKGANSLLLELTSTWKGGKKVLSLYCLLKVFLAVSDLLQVML